MLIKDMSSGDDAVECWAHSLLNDPGRSTEVGPGVALTCEDRRMWQFSVSHETPAHRTLPSSTIHPYHTAPTPQHPPLQTTPPTASTLIACPSTTSSTPLLLAVRAVVIASERPAASPHPPPRARPSIATTGATNLVQPVHEGQARRYAASPSHARVLNV